MPGFGVEYLARVEEHDAPSDAGKIAIDLISFDRRVIPGDRFENRAKLRDIPLTVFNLVDRKTRHILICELEELIEGPARGDDAQLLVEHEKGVADRIDDRAREGNGVWNGGERHQNGQPRSQTRAINVDLT